LYSSQKQLELTIMPSKDEAQAIIRWRNRNNKMLRENYRRQFIACGMEELLAVGTDLDVVKATAAATGKPFIIDWIPALTSDVQFY
jgi:hypothetical protein